MSKTASKHVWAFGPRFRSGSFGWRSEPAITRIKEAVSEIKAVARKEPVLAAEGAVLFLQKLSPALQSIDSSSGSIGTAVNRAIDALVPIIAKAPADQKVRCQWMEQLYQAHADDRIPYIECLGDYWGELCASSEIAAQWVDRLVETVDTVWSRNKVERGFYHGTSMCLSAMLAAGRHEQLLTLLSKCPYNFWSYRQWGVKALALLGKKAEALRYAEESRGLNEPVGLIAKTCEGILISSGLMDEAYERYAFEANHGATYLATFRAICRKYQHKAPEVVLNDLVARTPGEEGKWFAAAKDAELFDLALNLAKRSAVDHRTLIRAADDFVEKEPSFALNCGLLALYWICAEQAYEATTGEVLAAYTQMLRAAKIAQCTEAAMDQLRKTLESFPEERFVRVALAPVLAF